MITRKPTWTATGILGYGSLAFAAVVLLLAGCGGGGKPNVGVGLALPLSGDYAVYGSSIEKGIQLAAEELAADEAAAHTFTLVTEDTGGDPAKAAEVAAKLFADNFAVIGGVTSAEALAMLEPLKASNKLLISPSASSTELSGSAPGQFWRIYPNSDAEAVAMARFAKDTLKLESIAIMAEESDFGAAGAAAFAEAWQGELVAQLTFARGAAGSVIPELMEGPEGGEPAKALYLVARGSSLADAILALRGSGFDDRDGRILTTSALATPAVLAEAGTAAKSVYYTQTALDMGDGKPAKIFADAFQAKYGEAPDLYAAYGYDAMKVVATSITEGTVGKGGGTLFPEDLVKGMRAIKNYPGVTGAIQFRDSGDVQQFPRVFFVTEDQEMVDFAEWFKDVNEKRRAEMERIQRELEQINREARANG